MDALMSTDHMKKEEDSSEKLPDKLDVGVVVQLKDGVEEPAPTLARKEASLGPITPDPDRESGDLFDFQSPTTLVSSPLNLVRVAYNTHRNDDPDGADCSPRTPKEGVFDPFAPGPNDMALAPQCKKYMDESRITVARQLNFDSHAYSSVGDEYCSNHAETISDEEMLFESMYGSLLEAIVMEQTECAPAESPFSELDSDGFRTPTSAARLNGIAETCPGAPMKPVRKLRNVDLGLCRKLEF